MTRKIKNLFRRKSCKDVFGKSYSKSETKKSDETQNKCLKNPPLEDIAVQWLEELKPIRKKSTIVKYAG